MHELKLVRSLLDDLFKRAQREGINKITKVILRMGDFTELNEEIVRFFIENNSKGTVAEEAEVIIQSSPTRELRLVSFEGE